MPNAYAVLLIAACANAVAMAPALGEELSQRKSGLWEIKTLPTSSSTPPHSIELCIDQKTDDAIQQATRSAPRDMCTRNDVRREGDRIVVDSVCKFGESVATTHAEFSGTFESAYRVETSSTYDPPMAGVKEGSAIIEARWLSPCKADQRPGDLILSNGMKFNINDTKGQIPPMPPPSRRSPDPTPKQ